MEKFILLLFNLLLALAFRETSTLKSFFKKTNFPYVFIWTLLIIFPLLIAIYNTFLIFICIAFLSNLILSFLPGPTALEFYDEEFNFKNRKQEELIKIYGVKIPTHYWNIDENDSEEERKKKIRKNQNYQRALPFVIMSFIFLLETLMLIIMKK